MRYLSIPTEIEATQYTHPGCHCPGVQYEPVSEMTSRPFVETIQQQKVYIKPGEFVVKEPDGIHYYPIAPEVFFKKYYPA